MQFLKGFFYFLFFKIAVGLLFYSEYPIVAAAVVAASIVLIEYGVAKVFYTPLVHAYVAARLIGASGTGYIFCKMILGFIVSVLVGVLATYFLTVGFAATFYRGVLTSLYGDIHWREMCKLLAPIALMMFCNFLMVIAGMLLAARRQIKESQEFLK